MVGYNVQTAVDTTHHLMVAHEVTNVGHDRTQLANMAQQAKAIIETEELDVVADRGYFKGEEILACDEAGITTYLPKPQTSGSLSKGLFSKRDFMYRPADDEYECPAGERLIYRFTQEEKGKAIRRYWSSVCPQCPIKSQCTKSKYRYVRRWEHEAVVEAVQERLDREPERMRARSRDGRASLWNDQILDGFDALSDPGVAIGEYGDELACAGLQLETNDEHLWRKTVDRGNPGLKPAVCRLLAVSRALKGILRPSALR